MYFFLIAGIIYSFSSLVTFSVFLKNITNLTNLELFFSCVISACLSFTIYLLLKRINILEQNDATKNITIEKMQNEIKELKKQYQNTNEQTKDGE